MTPEEYGNLSIILDFLGLEELIRIRRRVEKRGGHAALADYLSIQIKRREQIEHEEHSFCQICHHDWPGHESDCPVLTGEPVQGHQGKEG
jgi:hypothetical protein